MKAGDGSMTALLADIGGTNARFALLDREGKVKALEREAVGDHATPEEAIGAYLRRQAARPRLAVLALAGPVGRKETHLTNADWFFDTDRIAGKLGFSDVVLVNDFAAVALGIPELEPGEWLELGGGPGDPTAPLCVLGAGTGLGVAALLPGGRAIASEGGHATLAPMDEEEARVAAVLRRRFGHVSLERALAGAGLENLRLALGELAGRSEEPRLPAAQVIQEARAGPGLSRDALDLYFRLLGGAAGNLALTFGALGGVWLSGGILPRLQEELAQSGCRARFEAKGRFAGYLRSIPLRLVLEPDPAFRGLAALARQRLRASP